MWRRRAVSGFCGGQADVRARRRTWKGRCTGPVARIEMETRAAELAALRLETGDRQEAAIRLYTRAGFVRRPAFGAYAAMTQEAVATSLFFEKLF